MATPKIFVSSTCYDLNILRGELRSFISGMGYEPFMSDFSDILFDPRQHTHSSCVQEVGTCDMLVLIVGRRYGGGAIPDAVAMLDFAALQSLSKNKEFLSQKDKFSITQLEVLKAIEQGVPVFSFVDAGVLNDHFTYERNKAKSILADIEFPNIDRQETAKYIFEFINFLRLRTSGNAIISFTRLEEIREHLRKQWAALFQRILYADRNRQQEARQFDALTNQIAGLQTAILSSISKGDLKETAKGAIQFRRLIEFISNLNMKDEDLRLIFDKNLSWDQLLTELGVRMIEPAKSRNGLRAFCDIVLLDGTYFQSRLPLRMIVEIFANQWEQFKTLRKSTRDAVLNAIQESGDTSLNNLRYVNEQYSDIASSTRIMEEDKLETEQNTLRTIQPLS